MSWFEISKLSFQKNFCHHTTCIEFFEHFHARRTYEFFWIFFIYESFTKTMKCFDIDPESVCTNKASQTIPHSKRACFCVGQSKNIVWRNICFCEYVCYSERQKLCLASTRSCYNYYWSIECINSLFLSFIEPRICGFKRIHRGCASLPKRVGKSSLICIKISARSCGSTWLCFFYETEHIW